MDNFGKFKKWLNKRGAIVLDPTNPYEVVRFKTVNGVSVIYRRNSGTLTFTGESEEAWKAYQNNKAWKAVDRKRQNLRAKKARLANRDGKMCFCCTARLGFDELTIEHILSFSHGGTDNENNLCLLCKECQKLLGNLPVAKKMLLIIQRRQGFGTLAEAGEVKDFPIITPIVDTKHLSPQCNHTVNEFCDHCITNGVKIESTPKGPTLFHEIFNDKLLNKVRNML